MSTVDQTSKRKTPKFQVMATWIGNMVAVLVVSSIVVAMYPEITTLGSEALREDTRLVLIPVITEIIAVGLLPVVFTLLNRDRAADYGLQRQGLLNSLAYSALVVLVFFAILSILNGQITTSINLPELQLSTFWKPVTALLAILAYGPLEVFFVIWLIHNTDRLYNSVTKILSTGLLVTILLYGVLHYFSQGVNALVIAAIFLLLGLIFKATRNAIGPLVAWTLMNNAIWDLVGILMAQ